MNKQDAYASTLLHYATLTRSLASVEYLVRDLCADLDIQDHDLNTALLLAIYCQYDEIAFFLIEQGADVTVFNQDGLTALHLAAARAHPELISRLLAQLIHKHKTTRSSSRQCRSLNWLITRRVCVCLRLTTDGCSLSVLSACRSMGVLLSCPASSRGQRRKNPVQQATRASIAALVILNKKMRTALDFIEQV